MTGSTIDHMVAVPTLLAALLVCLAIYNQTLSDAIAYQRNHQVAVKARDLIDNIVLGSGLPSDWGQSSTTPTAFGLQQPESGGFTLSPFAPMRLIEPAEPLYNGVFNNVSVGQGISLYLPAAVHVNQSTAERSLGISGSYRFQLSIAPTLNVSVSDVSQSPLRFIVQVKGPGGTVYGATVYGSLYYTSKNDPCHIHDTRCMAETDSTGMADLTFDVPDISAYAILVQVQVGGLVGLGFGSNSSDNDSFLVPLITDYEDGAVSLSSPSGNVQCNATFLIPSQNFGFNPVRVETDNSTCDLIPGQPGILLIAYNSPEKSGMVMVPWGIDSLGLSVKFGDDPASGNWVATELRQVTVGHISYQVKLAVWREGG